MATMTADEPLRGDSLAAQPIFIDPAYDDPERVIWLNRKTAPYHHISKIYGSIGPKKADPWFRIHWAKQGKLLDPDADFVFYNEHFIEASKRFLDATIVIPVTVMNNITMPMGDGYPHLDLPYFRGATGFNPRLLTAMRYSDLFQRWAVPLASIVSWFYEGEGGDFEYWPDGFDQPKQSLKTPLWNVAMASDNEYMYHGISAVGRPEERLGQGDISEDSILHAEPEGGWRIEDEGRSLHFADEKVRISMLWKAYAFKDEAALKRFRDPSFDLTVEQTLAIFDEDLRAKGIGRLQPGEGFDHPHNNKLILDTYALPHM